MYLFLCLYLVQARYPGHTPQLSELSFQNSRLVKRSHQRSEKKKIQQLYIYPMNVINLFYVGAVPEIWTQYPVTETYSPLGTYLSRACTPGPHYTASQTGWEPGTTCIHMGCWFHHLQVKYIFSYNHNEGRKEMFYLTMHSTHFIYGYMASDIWLRTILIVREETRCCHIGYSFRLTARVLLYAPSQRQDSTYHGLCYTSCGALAGTRNSSMAPPHEGLIRRPIAPWAN